MVAMMVILALIAVAGVGGFTWLLIAAQRDFEADCLRRMEVIERWSPPCAQERQPMGAMDLYLSSGRIPTGRTAEILALAQQSHDDRMRRGGRS